jgi:hypothetical protein
MATDNRTPSLTELVVPDPLGRARRPQRRAVGEKQPS